MNKITINGNEYPCRQTRGAFLRFKRETGREATDIKQELTDVLTFIYCCAASACDADHVEFNYTLMQFADLITPDMVNEWTAQMQAEAEANVANEQKKSPSALKNN